MDNDENQQRGRTTKNFNSSVNHSQTSDQPTVSRKDVMPTTMLENDDEQRQEPQEGTGTQPEVPEEKKEEQPLGLEPETPEVPETPEEPTIELEGKKYTATQIKEMEKAFTNSAEWQKTNTQKAQEIAEERRQLEERRNRVAMLEGLAEKVQSNPELLKQVFAPKQERDFDAELNAHWQRRPLDVNSQDYVNWEYQKDLIMSERAEERATKRAEQNFGVTTAQKENEATTLKAFDKYKEKVSKDEFAQMAGWIRSNIVPQNGKYPDNCFDIAYRNIYFDKELSEAKLSAAKSVADPLLKAKPADGQNGKKPPDNQKTEVEMDDDEFVAAAAAAGRG